ncbi:hypothetical protein O7A70_32870 [Mesorhizobium sp. Cs1299R1N1]
MIVNGLGIGALPLHVTRFRRERRRRTALAVLRKDNLPALVAFA